jgi:hypothetical protein
MVNDVPSCASNLMNRAFEFSVVNSSKAMAGDSTKDSSTILCDMDFEAIILKKKVVVVITLYDNELETENNMGQK